MAIVIQVTTRRLQHVEQDILTLPEHMRFTPVFGGIFVA